MNEWYKIADCPPEAHILVMFIDMTDEDQMISAGYRTEAGEYRHWLIATAKKELTYVPTHWRPLPESPHEYK